MGVESCGGEKWWWWLNMMDSMEPWNYFIFHSKDMSGVLGRLR